MSSTPWGLDGLHKRISDTDVSGIESMDAQQVRYWLSLWEQQAARFTEEQARQRILRRGGREYDQLRLDESLAGLQSMNLPTSAYNLLIDRSLAIAQTPDEQRAALLRKKNSLHDLVFDTPEFEKISGEATDYAGTLRMSIHGYADLSLDAADRLLESSADSGTREAIWRQFGNLPELQTKAHRVVRFAIENMIHVVNSQNYSFLGIPEFQSWLWEAPSPVEVEAMMRTFVEGTKSTYDRLVSDLLSFSTIQPWDLDFLLSSCDPLQEIQLPDTSAEILEMSRKLFYALGHNPALVAAIYPARPNVILDIEKRDGKQRGGCNYNMGPYSDKQAIYLNPVSFEASHRSMINTFPHEMGHKSENLTSQHLVFPPGGTVGIDPAFYYEALPAKEVLSTLHEHISQEPEALELIFGELPFDRMHLAKWKLLTDLFQIYKIIRVSLGEYALHRDPESAPEAFMEAEKFVSPSSMDTSSIVPCSSYVKTRHLYGSPGYYPSYFIADLHRLPLARALKQNFGSLLTPHTGPFLAQHIMKGNRTPMAERIASATGVHDPLENAIRYFNESYAGLSHR